MQIKLSFELLNLLKIGIIIKVKKGDLYEDFNINRKAKCST